MVSANVATSKITQPYEARRDEKNGTWYLLDINDKVWDTLSSDDDLPLDHPAVKVIPEAAFYILLQEAGKLGLLSKMNFTDTSDLEKRVQELELENERLKNEKAISSKDNNLSEGYRLKSKVIDSLLKVIVVDSINNES